MSTLPRFSLVVPSYNQAEFLEEALASIWAQDYPDLEVVVMDGGSTDGSQAIIERHAPRLTYWQSQPDGGQAAAIRAGFLRTGGEICGWLNSDDRLAPGALRRVGETFAARPELGWLYGSGRHIDRAGRPIGGFEHFQFDYGILLYFDTIITQPACFWRRELYDRAGGLDPSYNCSMDFDLWLRLGKLATPLHLPEVLAEARIYPQTKSSTLGPQIKSEHRRAQISALGGRVWPGQLRLGRWWHYLRLQRLLLPRLPQRLARRLRQWLGWGQSPELR